MTCAWTVEHLRRLRPGRENIVPPLAAGETGRLLETRYLWDFWPVTEPDGGVALFQGQELWMALAAPADGKSDQRHDKTRLRALSRTQAGWIDHGPVLPDGFSLGSHEWTGSTIYQRSSGIVTLYYTAVGRRG